MLEITSEQHYEIRRQARLELARRYAAEKDILNWGKMIFPEKFTLPFCEELHRYIVDIRAEPLTDTEAPRNHAKTVIKCFLIPLFQALEEPKTFTHYLNVQATHEKAVDVNRSIKVELETNLELRELYGNQIGERWSEKQFVLANGVIFTAIGAGQSIRGINYRNIRPDYLIVDDLYDDDDINNQESTQKKNDWFWSGLYPARAKSKRCSVHLQGTAINQGDLLEDMKTKPGVIARTFKAVKDWATKVVLWPQLNSFKSLEQDRELMGSVIFMREMQNERRDDATSIIKKAWLEQWEYEPRDLKFDERFQLVDVLLCCDPSIGEKSENDYTAVALVLKTKWADSSAHEYWIEGLWNEHLSQNERVLLLERIANEQPESKRIRRAVIEGIAGFKDFVAEVKRRTELSVREVDKVPDKITNLENKSSNFESKRVHMNKQIDPKLKKMLHDQLTTNRPKHDDLRDAVLLSIDRVTRRAPGIHVIE